MRSGIVTAPALLLLRVALIIQGLCASEEILELFSFSSSVKNANQNFDGNCVAFVYNLQ